MPFLLVASEAVVVPRGAVGRRAGDSIRLLRQRGRSQTSSMSLRRASYVNEASDRAALIDADEHDSVA
jgi:hypothetical protein